MVPATSGRTSTVACPALERGSMACCCSSGRNGYHIRQDPYPGKDAPQQVSRHGYLRHLEGDVRCTPHDLGPDLDQLVPEGGQRPVLHKPQQRKAPQEVLSCTSADTRKGRSDRKGISRYLVLRTHGGSGSDSEVVGPFGQSLRALWLKLPLGREGYISPVVARDRAVAMSRTACARVPC